MTRAEPAEPVGHPPADPANADFRAARIDRVAAWMAGPRFAGLTRLHTAADVVDQQGSIVQDHPVAREAAASFHDRLRECSAAGRSITTFGPYTPGQAVTMKRLGIEGIYLGGWATSAKGAMDEDPGPDLASYPLSAVPDEAAGIVRALLTADRNQAFSRSRMAAPVRDATPPVDYRPWIIADADTGHGGDAHVRNLIRRFVEVGVPGYHIEDQRPGAKKCGHQDGKVLVASAEQVRRLNAARLQLDIMGVPGIIVARTDAEAGALLDDISDERDQPFVLGATATDVPAFRVAFVALLQRLERRGLPDVHGHRLFGVPTATLDRAGSWLDAVGLGSAADDAVATALEAGTPSPEVIDVLDHRLVEVWAQAAALMTVSEALDGAIAVASETRQLDAGALAAWRAITGRASIDEARRAAAAFDLDLHWDPELPRTPDGFYRIRAGIESAIARSITAAPFADLLWMETKTADLADARRFAVAVHAVHPGKMLAYNLSPSFSWDTTGMTEEEMRRFPADLGRLGFVFAFITYGGHQVDGSATEEFVRDLQRDGMLALARLQRRLRLLDSPYRTPQALVGGDRLDAALLASTGRTAATKAMGAASTHKQHLVAVEPGPTMLAERLAAWATAAGVATPVRVELRAGQAWSDEQLVHVADAAGAALARVTATPVRAGDRGRVLVLGERWAAAHARAALPIVEAFLLERTRADRVVALDAVVAGDRPEVGAAGGRSPQPSERIPVA
jgi:isocitrate lyase